MSHPKILVLGSRGQVGHSLVQLLGSRAETLDRPTLDLSAPESLLKCLDETYKDRSPGAIINSAAYTLVDKAEQESDLARAVNGIAPGVLAKWCKDRKVPFVHFSTDYVFNGTGTRPWREDDEPQPLNAYGRSKLEGECSIAENGQNWLIFRTSWVYSPVGQNFMKTMLRLGKEREEISVVTDQHGAPTFAADLAQGTLKALDAAQTLKTFPSGIYHLCSSGETTWFEFAEKIFERARARGWPLQLKRLIPITSEAFASKVVRPKNSRLSLIKAKQSLGVELQSWEDGLKSCMKEMS
jgi:dTDP-4-dehydrorhamnose reductase